jgi:ureidoacrylate peracid hydrolase
MHNSAVYPWVVDRVVQRRGGLRVFDRLDSKRTAHIVVDLQNGFMAPGAICEIPEARAIVPTVNAISAAVRDAGGLVVYIQNTLDEEAIRTWSTYLDHFCSPSRRQGMIDAFTPGAEGHALWASLDVRAEDLKVRKRRFGAFVGGSSDLHAILQARGVDTLIITGTASQVCCESTARDAMMLNYKVFFVTDGNATFTDEEHNATLSAMAHTFCDVIRSDELIALIGQDHAKAKTARDSVMA